MSCPDPDPTQARKRAQLVEEIQAIDEANAARVERERYGPSGDRKMEAAVQQAAAELSDLLRKYSYRTLAGSSVGDALRVFRKLYIIGHEEGQVLECARNSRLGGTTASGLPELRADGTKVYPRRGIV